jgi:histidine triad (HIT) family protein
MPTDCIFCKIIQGEIPSQRILETDRAVAFLDIAPVNFGHVLLVPRAHHRDLLELSDDDAAYLGGLLPKLCRAVMKATGAVAFHVVVNNGEVAGQTVFHGHWHIIPRSRGDAVRWPWPHLKYEEGAMTRMKDEIQAALDQRA